MLTTTMQKDRKVYIKKTQFQPDSVEGNRALRSEEVLKAQVAVDGYVFDADENSMDRLDRVVDIANWRFNKAIAEGASSADAYAQVYLSTMVPWKTSDNQFGYFSVELLCRVQELALNQLAVIWMRYG